MPELLHVSKDFGPRKTEGVELLADTGFDNAPSWTQGGLLFTVTGVATAVVSVINVDYLQQTITGLLVGRLYRLVMELATRTAGTVQVDAVGGATIIAAQSVPGRYVGYFTATAASHDIRLNGALFSGTVSSLSMKAY